MNGAALRKGCGNAIRELIFYKPKSRWAFCVNPLIPSNTIVKFAR